MPRLATRSAELSRRTRAVTSPISSSGSTTGPLSRKWSIHRSCRGLNNRIRSPEPVNDAIFEPLYRLQTIHAYARLSAVVWPPCFLLTT
jgi:hypothetical protein